MRAARLCLSRTAAATQPAFNWDWTASLGHGQQPISKLGLVLMNTPLSERLLRNLWNISDTHICADGAANLLLKQCSDLVPCVIVGDFDSVSPSVVETYRGLGVDIRNLSHDQLTTDLQKALAVAGEQGCEKVVISGKFAGVGGRLDHTFGIVNALFRHTELQPVVMGDDSVMFLLPPGEHEILVPNFAMEPHCGLVPIGGSCDRISTTGLRWNMEDASMEFGSSISVCNRVDPEAEGRVWVKTGSPVLWMCTLPSRFFFPFVPDE